MYVPIIQSTVMGFAIITAALLSAWLGTKAYRHQKTIDREEELRQLRAKEYERFVNVLVQRWQYRRWPSAEQDQKWREHLTHYDEARWNLFLIGSDEVIRTAAALDWHLVSGENDTQKYIQLYTDMLFAMRADSFVVSQLDRDEIGQMFPLKYNIPFNYPPELAEQIMSQNQRADERFAQYQKQNADQVVNSVSNDAENIKVQTAPQLNKAPQQSWWQRMLRK